MIEIEPGSLCITERVENHQVVREVKAIIKGTMDMVGVGSLDAETVLKDLKLQCAAASDEQTTYGVSSVENGRFEFFTFTLANTKPYSAKPKRQVISLTGILDTLDALSIGLSRKRNEGRDEPI
jgi:hypothetical protein